MGIFGYLDAGTGSMIASGIAAGGAAVVVVFVTFRDRLMNVLSPKRRRAAAEAREAASADAEAEPAADQT